MDAAAPDDASIRNSGTHKHEEHQCPPRMTLGCVGLRCFIFGISVTIIFLSAAAQSKSSSAPGMSDADICYDNTFFFGYLDWPRPNKYKLEHSRSQTPSTAEKKIRGWVIIGQLREVELNDDRNNNTRRLIRDQTLREDKESFIVKSNPDMKGQKWTNPFNICTEGRKNLVAAFPYSLLRGAATLLYPEAVGFL
ncbi:hypothetical protein IW262DRAFT_1294008 [Armillaria fumosa]|nr:hypothetical protein IW262DRAFT_1294008 [Armillaria fumosa]